MWWKKLHISAKLFLIVGLIYGGLKVWSKLSDDEVVKPKEAAPTYGSVKNENSKFFHTENSKRIQSILFEFKYNSIKSTLILRSDSVVGIINRYRPELNNCYNQEGIAKEYEVLYSTIEDNISLFKEPSSHKQRKLGRRIKGIDIWVYEKDGYQLYYNINGKHLNDTNNDSIIQNFVDLVSTIYYEEIDILQIIRKNNEQEN